MVFKDWTLTQKNKEKLRPKPLQPLAEWFWDGLEEWKDLSILFFVFSRDFLGGGNSKIF